MCFGGGSKDEYQPPPTPVVPPPLPQPVPPTETAPMETADRKRRKIEALKYGMLSTMKTGGQGVVGTGAELNKPIANEGKKTLGE